MKMTKSISITLMKLSRLPWRLSWIRQAVILNNLNFTRYILTICFLLFGLSILGTSVSYADGTELFTMLPSDQLRDVKPAQTQRIDQIKQRPTTQSVTLMRIDVNALSGNSTRMTLSDAKTLNFDKSNVETRNATDYTWFGSLSGVQGKATLVVHDGNITGTIRDNGNLYRVESVGNGVHAVIKVDESRFPPDHPPSFKKMEKHSGIGLAPIAEFDAKSSDGPVGIDVLVAYTAAARTSVSDIAATIQLAVAEANQSYKNSGVNIKLTLVDNLEVAYSETGKTFDTILADFVSMANVNSRRNSIGADMAAMIINQADFCGLADAIQANASTAFAIVHYDCATGYYSFAHELGHLQGARHDPANDPTTTPFAYGHGLQHTSPAPSWRTIMAYNCAGGCSRLQYWSNPNIKYNGIAMGTAATNDNARVLNGTASTVASFKARPPVSDVGSIWQYTGTPCSGNSCPGWQVFDNNAATVRIAAGGSQLYQLHNTGKIWKSTGVACSGNSCPGWQMLDNNPATIGIATDGGQLYQLHNSGKIWRYTGAACSGNSCPGWNMLDNNPATIAIASDGGQLYQLHNTGKIWRFTGTLCSGNSCPGWQMLDNNAATVSITAGGGKLYQLHNTGKVWRFTGSVCSGNSCPGWQMLDNNPATIGIVAGSQLYQLHNTGKIWKSTGAACSGNSCPGWQMFDNNPATIGIYAEANQLYQLHNTGKIWKSTGAACSGNSCPGWQMLDNNPNTGRVAAGGGKLYQLHLARTPMTRVRICYECK